MLSGVKWYAWERRASAAGGELVLAVRWCARTVHIDSAMPMATVTPHVTTTLWLYLRKGAYGNCFEGLLDATLPFSEPSSRAPAVDSSAILASEVPEKCARDVPPVAGAAPSVPRGGAARLIGAKARRR